jgi:SSS family solute:Na+ symporter
MYLTKPAPDAHLDRFYRRVRPGGYWGPVAERCPEVVCDQARHGWFGWLFGVICIYMGLYGVGVMLLGKYLPGMSMIAGCLLFGWLTLRAVGPGNMSPEGQEGSGNAQ